MRILFVHSEEDAYTAEKPISIAERVQFGISYIAAYLQAAGQETHLVVISEGTQGRVEEAVRRLEPGLVCFTAVYSQYHFIAPVAASLKRAHPELFLILGGAHASLKPNDCAKDGFDALCIGEGEQPALELVRCLEAGKEPAGIANLWLRREGEWEKNPPRPFLADLDELPFPDRGMWRDWMAFPESRPSILAARGCPFDCTYCCNHALQRLAPGKYVRFRSPDNIVRELEELADSMPLPNVYLEVETLGVNKRWAQELCGRLADFNGRREVPVAFGTNLRITRGNHLRELFGSMREAGFSFVNIGLESGSERIRREVLKRDYSNDDVIEAVRLAHENGMQVGTYNLIGIPGETPSDFRETVKVNRACQPDWFLLSVFFPYPGTDLHQVCEEEGLLEGEIDMQFERRRPVLDQPCFSKRQVQRSHRWFVFNVYRGNRPLRDIIMLVLRSRIFQSPVLLKVFRRFSKAVA
ncbi:MAG: B12-binding domain-containing radical SAM protein [Candidatus Geothermincolia bacterium]